MQLWTSPKILRPWWGERKVGSRGGKERHGVLGMECDWGPSSMWLATLQTLCPCQAKQACGCPTGPKHRRWRGRGMEKDRKRRKETREAREDTVLLGVKGPWYFHLSTPAFHFLSPSILWPSRVSWIICWVEQNMLRWGHQEFGWNQVINVYSHCVCHWWLWSGNTCTCWSHDPSTGNKIWHFEHPTIKVMRNCQLFLFFLLFSLFIFFFFLTTTHWTVSECCT